MCIQPHKQNKIYVNKTKGVTELDHHTFVCQMEVSRAGTVTSTPYVVLPLFATMFAACAGGISDTYIEPYLI